MITSSKFIDNTRNKYLPIKLKCGITIQCRPEIISVCPSIIQTLEKDVQDCIKILPPSTHNLIRRIKIWVNVNYLYGAIDDPRVLKHTTAHHHRQWLESVNDIPQKTLGVEIYNCFEYESMRLHWNGCGLLLHEFCHLIHQIILEDGLQNEMIMNAFGTALESGLYDDVLRRDWAFLPLGEDRDTAYCTINHKEFFSEMSVAFLSRCYDNYLPSSSSPLNMKIEDNSPPMMAPEVIERMEEGGFECRKSTGMQNWVDKLNQVVGRKSSKGHCNKFFPFTHQQLRQFDPFTYAVFQQAWSQIAEWEDPEGGIDKNCTGCFNVPTPLLGLLNSNGKEQRKHSSSSFGSLDETFESTSDHEELILENPDLY